MARDRSQLYNAVMRQLPDLFAALANSAFRRRFRLGTLEHRYLNEKGLEVIAAHARDFIRDRLAPARPTNDGSQTPMCGHPVFIAQHATATCCRSCLAKWHGIAKGNSLNDEETDYVISVLTVWIESQGAMEFESSTKPMTHQRRLFA